MSHFRAIALLPLAVVLSGCNAVVLHPAGDVAVQQRDLVVISTILMLLIIIPVMVLTVWFAWHYRQSNTSAHYEPNWDHSTHLELVIWSAPLLIIICLGALTWMGSHLLDPYRPIGRIAPGEALQHDAKRLRINVVALDWKWLFIYPDYGVATVNDLAAPVGMPIDFRLTSSSVMNSFYIPALAGQIYTMPGMRTTLHAVINKPGIYRGFSANYSGAGFSGMHFPFSGLSNNGFDAWIADVKSGGGDLTRTAYLKLQRPSENVPAQHYASVDAGLFDAILNLCVEPGKMCMSEMSAIDAKGGLGLAGIANVMPPSNGPPALHGRLAGAKKSYVASVCTKSQPSGLRVDESPMTPVKAAPLLGADLPHPGSLLQSIAQPRPSNS